MGILTLQQIHDEIKSNHGNRDDIVDRLPTIIDLAMLRIARVHDWDELKYTIIDNFVVTTPDTAANRRTDRLIDLDPAAHGDTDATDANDFRVKNVYLVKVKEADTGRAKVLHGFTVRDFDERYPDPDFNDRNFPQAYTWFGNRDTMSDSVNSNVLTLWPAPDETYEYSIRMQVYPRFLSGSKTLGDRSDFHELDDAIIHLSTSIIYLSKGREDKSNTHFGIFSAIMQEAMSADEKDFHQLIAGVRVQMNTDAQNINKFWADPFFKAMP